MKHAKGKLEIDGVFLCITDENDSDYADYICMMAPSLGDKEQRANAKRLVLCWNSHDDLWEGHNMNAIEAKAALKARYLHKHGTDISPIINGFIECLQRIIKRSEAAIAKAEKGKTNEEEPQEKEGN